MVAIMQRIAQPIKCKLTKSRRRRRRRRRKSP